eukprot:gnl/TRDRNA2_/TRDRNA2_201195_c0_seq1.p1 gnl/TRDRNA2_/TRDRNA2_201195_c0~~gnl/TRDRNA2_/TRDRNA2_201195_c0_seq1.p1  ORF type:complete len:321 (-),score=64.67 gnl/TRDRNA2_/TRDRNA2_201195_c0_seq1:52-1014(-)
MEHDCVASLLKRPLAQVLQEAKPSWDSTALNFAVQKLEKVGIRSTEELADALAGRNSMQLNEQLETAGLRGFRADTIEALRVYLVAQWKDVARVLQDARPGWKSKDLLAALVKLMLAGIISEAELLESLAESGSECLNARLARAGLKMFALDTIQALRLRTGVEPQRSCAKEQANPNEAVEANDSPQSSPRPSQAPMVAKEAPCLNPCFLAAVEKVEQTEPAVQAADKVEHEEPTDEEYVLVIGADQKSRSSKEVRFRSELAYSCVLVQGTDAFSPTSEEPTETYVLVEPAHDLMSVRLPTGHASRSSRRSSSMLVGLGA